MLEVTLSEDRNLECAHLRDNQKGRNSSRTTEWKFLGSELDSYSVHLMTRFWLKGKMYW